jgi:hypothetical protein
MNQLPRLPSIKFALIALLLILAVFVVETALAGPVNGQSTLYAGRMLLPTRGTLSGGNTGGNTGAIRLAGTATALAGKAIGTTTALAGRAVDTTTALAGRAAGTATALYAKAAATATAFVSRVAPTLTALAINIDITATLPADQAAAALTSYAAQVLGTAVTVTKASGETAAVTANLAQTDNSAAAQSAVIKLATTSYGGILSSGAATLSYGTGTLSGDINLDVQSASLGVYSLVVTTKAKPTADEALALAKATFPYLAGFDYAVYPVSSGYAWYAAEATSAIDPETGQVVSMPETVILYVLPASNGKVATVTATVGRGDFTKSIELPSE